MLTAKKSAFVLPLLLVVNLASSFLPATAFAGELHSVQRLVVVDANGKLVGEVIDTLFGYNPLLAFRQEGKLFMVALTPDSAPFFGITGTGIGNGAFYFESTDCSGAPLMYRTPDFVLPTVVNPPGMTVYVPDTSVIPQDVNFNSVLGEVGGGATCGTFSGTLSLVPAVPVVDLGSLFTPPFSVRGY